MQDAHGSNQDDASTAPVSPAAAERPELRYRFECETIDEFGALYAPDISRGGIFIRTHQVLPLASAVKIELLLANERPFISAEGLVFWTRASAEPGTTQGEPGMGIRFTRMSPDSHRNLTRILAVKQAEDWIRAAEAAAELEAESRSPERDDDEIGDLDTAVVKIADLRAVVAKAAAPAPEAFAPAQPMEAAAAVTAVVSLEALASDTAPCPAPPASAAESDPSAAVSAVAAVAAEPSAPGSETAAPPPAAAAHEVAEPRSVPSPPSGPAPVSVPRSLSRPIPALPDWAFVATRFGAARVPASSAIDSSADAERAAVPTLIPDTRDASFGAPGSVATQTVSTQSKAVAPESSGRLRLLRQHAGLRLVVGAALVLVTALAVAPRPKTSKPAGRTRVGAVVAPAARPAPTAQAAPSTSAPAYPKMFGPEPAPSFERMVSSR